MKSIVIELINTYYDTNCTQKRWKNVGFNEEKIKSAIRKAMAQTNLGEDYALIHQITDQISTYGLK